MVVNTNTSNRPLVIYLIGLVGAGHENTTFPPAIALVTADRP